MERASIIHSLGGEPGGQTPWRINSYAEILSGNRLKRKGGDERQSGNSAGQVKVFKGKVSIFFFVGKPIQSFNEKKPRIVFLFFFSLGRFSHSSLGRVPSGLFLSFVLCYPPTDLPNITQRKKKGRKKFSRDPWPPVATSGYGSDDDFFSTPCRLLLTSRLSRPGNLRYLYKGWKHLTTEDSTKFSSSVRTQNILA